jgi:hypothetical protein
MKFIILAVLLSSCSMVHKASNKQMKDSTAVLIDQSEQFVSLDSTSQTSTKQIETSDLVIVFKDTATGFVSFIGDSISIPAQAIKEIRQKKKKAKEKQETSTIQKEVAILTDTRQKITVKEKTVTKDKHVTRISWMWIILAIAAILLYMSRKRIYAIFKALTI